MEKRSYRRSRYVVALFITLVIFLFGILLGVVMEGRRVSYLENENKLQQLKYSSLQLQYQFIDQLSREENCPALTGTLEESISSLEAARANIENYQKDAMLNAKDFALLKQDYLINQLRYWLLAKKTNALCNNRVTMILYFYSTDAKCPDCAKQAFILTYLKKRFGDSLLNFAIDSEFKTEPMVEMLLAAYNVTTYPTLVINDKPLYGLTENENVLKEICFYLENQSAECN